MKVCPRCQKTYADDNLNFCLDDGTVLTQTSSTVPETVMMNQPRVTDPRPTMPGRPVNQSPAWDKNPQYAVQPKKSSKTWLWVVGILGLVVVLCGGGFGVLALIGMNMNTDSDKTPNRSTSKTQAGSTPTASSSNNWNDNSTTRSTPSFSKADASKGEMPPDAELQEMVKTTLLNFDSAVQRADFTEFYAQLCKPWQKQTTPESLKTSFQAFIDKGISIKSIGSLEAEFSPTPTIGRELGFTTLKVEGKYATSPNTTKFELNYIPEGKAWKLSKIVVDTTSTP